ncbi:hypothetical protein GCM10022243_61910 [Saccharothrix violaceirubra]|uniref:TIR domain-containing protein n=1 Tax=Saccharothrix violaceirubra TaxID=413306 RepID=A0A7W7T7S5_9PSEU|nr:TIR domain-containing protein [Saccharothrix violaceirubra]MBB4968167.1 hypothetical protein [Saccharothrix violaceirubra]
MPGAFVNYRSGPHAEAVAAIAESLRRHFGADRVFVDHQMRKGSRYPDELRAALRDAEVVVAVVHQDWVARFGNEVDWVLWELREALDLGIPVVPVLLGDTPPPTSAELPAEIGEFAHRQASRLRAVSLTEDMASLLHELEKHITQPIAVRERPEPKRVAFWPRVLGWTVGTAAYPALIAVLLGAEAINFATAALSSTFILAVSLLAHVAQLLTVRQNTRLERRLGVLPVRAYVRKIWFYPLVAMVVLLAMMADNLPLTGVWWFAVVGLIALGLWFYGQRLFDARDEKEKEWPPTPSLEPYLYRRAAAHLHERLTTWPEWRWPRSRLHQGEAVAVYLDLTETKLALESRTRIRLGAWLRQERCGFSRAHLGWGAGIVAMYVVAALVLRPEQLVRDDGTLPTRAQLVVLTLFFGVAALVAAALTFVTLLVEVRIGRKSDRLLVAELEEWQSLLGPLVFVRPEDTRAFRST